jgi:GntR family phosphonate transport system transcriptional regulator
MAGAEAVTEADGLALWRQIERAIAADIAARLYPPGERLPTEQALAARFGVNRHTLRRAMAALEARGLVRIEQGRGSFVQDPVLDYAVGRHTRFSEIVSRHNRAPGHRLLRVGEILADGAVARALRLRKGARCLMMETLGEVDGRPVALGTHYLPAARFPGIAERYAESQSLSVALRSYGVTDYTRHATRIIARLPTAEEAAQLKQQRTRPVLVTESVDIDAAESPIQFVISRFAGDRVQILVES